MFYKIIQRKRNEWLSREDCPIKSLLAYIERKGAMRDAQIEAIKTYLFLKIACENKPLWRLFSEGNVFKLWQVSFNSFHSDRVEKKITDFNLKGRQQALKRKKEFKPITLSEDGLETIEFLSIDCVSADLPLLGTAIPKSSLTNSATFARMASTPKPFGTAQ